MADAVTSIDEFIAMIESLSLMSIVVKDCADSLLAVCDDTSDFEISIGGTTTGGDDLISESCDEIRVGLFGVIGAIGVS